MQPTAKRQRHRSVLPDARRVEWQLALPIRTLKCPRGRARRSRSRDRWPAAATACRRQTASGRPGTLPPPSPDAPETPPAGTPPAAAARSPLPHCQAHDVASRRRLLDPAGDVLSVEHPAVRLDGSSEVTVVPLSRIAIDRQRSTALKWSPSMQSRRRILPLSKRDTVRSIWSR